MCCACSRITIPSLLAFSSSSTHSGSSATLTLLLSLVAGYCLQWPELVPESLLRLCWHLLLHHHILVHVLQSPYYCFLSTHLHLGWIFQHYSSHYWCGVNLFASFFFFEFFSFASLSTTVVSTSVPLLSVLRSSLFFIIIGSFIFLFNITWIVITIFLAIYSLLFWFICKMCLVNRCLLESTSRTHIIK